MIENEVQNNSNKSFLKYVSQLSIVRRPISTLQVNLGKMCNQACLHCHVEAGPLRTEIMTKDVMDLVIQLVKTSPQIKTIDLTGGAPELNPNFRYFVTELKKLNKKIIDRCNLTVLFEKGQEDTASFLAKNNIEVVSSLPCYSKENVEKQRGKGVFDKSIKALIKLNELGYGKENSGLVLNLVYNPGGAFLPPSQEKLQADYKKELFDLFGIEFNQLFAITNMPIKRFLWDLERQNKLNEYMDLLIQSFNPSAATEVMCRDLISVGWDGQLYDCDFNQMLELPLKNQKTIHNLRNVTEIQELPIKFANHCFGCTAGSGSSCGGELSN